MTGSSATPERRSSRRGHSIEEDPAALIDFDWDDPKAEANERKHGVTFPESITAFRIPLSVTCYDPQHADDVDRFLTMGSSVDGRLSDWLTRMATSPDESGPIDDLQPEYDFRSLRGLVRGKYAAR